MVKTIKRQVRNLDRTNKLQAQFDVLLLESDSNYALSLKQVIESRLQVSVTIVRTVAIAKKLLEENPHQYFIGITSVLGMDSSEFEKIDLLSEFGLPIIAIVEQYEDEMRDQLIKRHAIDYVVKGNKFDSHYICDLIARVHKNCDIKVLVVDDSRVSRFIIARELILQKFQVLHASNGVEALKMLEEHGDIKLVLVDNQMPIMNGYEFTAQAREIYSSDELIIIGVSSSTDPRISVKFLKAGSNDFIAKPFNYEILLCRISRNLDMLDAVNYAKHLSNVDFLSNLFNRRYFFEQGNKILEDLATQSSEDNVALTVMMMDIDFFKKVNDKYGHDAGDEVIKHFAAEMKSHFHADIVARLGGEEFAVLSTSPSFLKSFDYIDAFREHISNQVVLVKNETIRYSCSIGVTNILSKNLNEMMLHADRLLYKAKQNGRNRIEGRPVDEDFAEAV